MEFHKNFEKLNLVLIGIVGVYVQGTKNPLFDTNAANMWSTLLAIVVFCCSGEINCSELATVVSRSLVSVSLISTLLPVKIGLIIIYIIYTAWTFAGRRRRRVASNMTRRRRRVASNMTRRRRRVASNMTLTSYGRAEAGREQLPIHQQDCNPPRNGNFISTILTLEVFGYLIPTIAAVVGASTQGIAQPLKETHRVSLCVFLVAIIVHYIAFAFEKVSQRNQANPSQLWGLIAIISGSLSTVALISMFFTHSVAEIICYIALGCAAFIIVAYQYGSMLMNACRWMYHEILRPFFFNTLNWFQANIHLFNRAAATVSGVSVEV